MDSLNRPYDAALILIVQGNMYMTDSSNNRIQIFDPEGKFLQQFGRERKDDEEFVNPSGICIDRNNTVYVVDHGNNHVSVFMCEGKFLTSFSCLGDGPCRII